MREETRQLLGIRCMACMGHDISAWPCGWQAFISDIKASEIQCGVFIYFVRNTYALLTTLTAAHFIC